MVRLEDLQPGSIVKGLIPGKSVTVKSIEWMGSALSVYYTDPMGASDQQLLMRSNEAQLDFVADNLHWQFNADPELMKIISEAVRIRLAYLFDPNIAVHTSLIEPLPHQITAVYSEMLSKQPLRFLLADDPGAGKTIMTGLLIKELIIRGDLKRCLIVCPGNLATQWVEDELLPKFGLEFEMLTNDRINSTRSGNPFLDIPLCVARLDKLARDTRLQEMLKASDWDLVVCDEAHKMSASIFGGEVHYTKRYQLGQLLSEHTRHFLLLTATPHNGKEEDFQQFMRLIDKDRFEGSKRGAEKVDLTGLMRRLIKEELLTFEGKRLFPMREAHTARYKLSASEQSLYDHVTEYVRQGFSRAEQLMNPDRVNAVGFALTILQRRLASSPEAIHQSLRRRRERLEARLEELRMGGLSLDEGPEIEGDVEEWEEEFYDRPEEEIFRDENGMLDKATAARTLKELALEIDELRDLEKEAFDILRTGQDSKWIQLIGLLRDEELMKAPDGTQNKLIIFTEHRDTLEYLRRKIANHIGSDASIVTIRGGMNREDRRTIEAAFKQDPTVRILIATDAAGEGINLQRAHLLINYDLPWNPNRIEQRFGRIHRIGQRDTCHMWNLVAEGTREGDVFQRLFEKLEQQRKALGGRVFDVLGRITYNDKSLRDLLLDAIRQDRTPERMQWLDTVVDDALDLEKLQELLKDVLATDSMGISQVMQVKDEMDRNLARRLQPHHIEAFFITAFRRLGGQVTPRGSHVYSVPRVPAILRGRDERGVQRPVVERYERIAFEKQALQREGLNTTDLICPGHPLLESVIDAINERYQPLLKQGSVYIDESGTNPEPRLLFYLSHTICDGRVRNGQNMKASERMFFVEMDSNGNAQLAGFAPYLDYRAPTAEEAKAVAHIQQDLHWTGMDVERRAIHYAVDHLIMPHFQEKHAERNEYIDKVKRAVTDRLEREILHQNTQEQKFREQYRMGKDTLLNADNAAGIARHLRDRLDIRLTELENERTLINKPPVVLGGALVIPAELLHAEPPQAQPQPGLFGVDRKAIEMAAMNRVMDIERAQGHIPRDVSAERLGWDIESTVQDPSGDGRHTTLFLEVKGRQAGATTVTVTRNEIVTALNQPATYRLAIVEVDGESTRCTYLVRPFRVEPDMGANSVNYDISQLMANSQSCEAMEY